VGGPGLAPGSVLFTTYNLLDLGAEDSASGAEHYAAVPAAIASARSPASA
jgi:hypothetical protein